LIWIISFEAVGVYLRVEFHHDNALKAVNTLLRLHGVESSKEVTISSSAGAPKLFNGGFVVDFLSRTGPAAGRSVVSGERVTAKNLLPLRGPFVFAENLLVKEERYILERDQHCHFYGS
jgi:hypothetical protein